MYVTTHIVVFDVCRDTLLCVMCAVTQQCVSRHTLGVMCQDTLMCVATHYCVDVCRDTIISV